MAEPIKNRYEFVVLFDVENGNPNGDPDAGNMPRIDPETGHGIVTDVCLKRKIRNYVELVKEDADGYRIYVKSGTALKAIEYAACRANGITAAENDIDKALKKAKKEDGELDNKLRNYMCSTFYDIRTFGAVMTTFTKNLFNCGNVRGPVQIGFSKSIDPIMPQEIRMVRSSVFSKFDLENRQRYLVPRSVIPYALYRVEGYVSANLARTTTGFSEDDLNLLWEAILNMFEHDHTAARGKMTVRKLIVFKHKTELGEAPAHKLFERVSVVRKNDVMTARSYDDYVVAVDEDSLPNGVTCTQMD